MAINFLNNAAFAGNVTTNGDITIDNSAGDPFLKLKTTAQEYVIRVDQSDSEKFQIRDTTNNATRLTIDSTGNVGIGATSPTATLDVNSQRGTATNLATTKTAAGFDLNSNTVGGSNSLTIGETNQTSYFLQHANSAGTTTYDIALNPYGGNVGIGTASPDAKLHIVGKQMITAGANASPQTEDYLFIGGDGLGGANASIYIGNRGDGTGYGWRMFYEGVGSGVNNKLKFKSENLGSPVDVITMTQDGNVGIGMDSPTNKLVVRGLSSSGVASADNVAQFEGPSGTNGFQVFVDDTNNNTGIQAKNGDDFLLNPLGGNIGIGTDNPVPALHVYQNNTKGGTAAGLTIEQEGTGDAVLSFLLTGTERWKMGIDNSDADKFKISKATNLSTDNALTIDADLNVGIGTTSPDTKLSISDTLGISGTGNDTYGQVDLVNTQTGASGDGIGPFITFRGKRGGVDSVVAAYGAIGGVNTGTTGSSAGAITFLTKNTTGAAEDLVEQMRISTGGNVGIGTPSPTSLLEISKQLSAASTIDYPYTISSRDDGGLINQLGGEGVGIKFRIAGNDATTPGNSLVGASIAAIKEGSSDTNSSAGLGFFVSQDDETLDEAVRIDHDGNVGINDTTPSYKLDVNGEGRFIGDLRCLSLIQTSQSDKKEFIQDIVKTTNKKIEFKEYVYKSDSGNRKRYGVLAEDIEVDYPELVHIDADGVKGVNYIDLLVKRVAEIERELENVYLTAQVDSSIQLADDLAAPSASKDNDGDYFDAIGSDAAHGNTLSGKTIFSNQSLPSYTNRASATTAITVANGASAGDTYLYYNSSNFQIEGVRL